MGLSVGRYSYDETANMGAGIWSSFIVLIAALETLWCLRSAKYWKLHLSFALHIIGMLATIVLLISELAGNIPHLRYKIGQVLYEDDNDYDRYNDRGYYSMDAERLENGTVVQREVYHKFRNHHSGYGISVKILNGMWGIMTQSAFFSVLHYLPHLCYIPF